MDSFALFKTRPYQHQNELLAFAEAHPKCFYLADCGCQPAGEKVLMKGGVWKNVEEIKIGDEVLSPQNDETVIPTKVISVKKYTSEIYTVELGRGRRSQSFYKRKNQGSYRVAREHLIVGKCSQCKNYTFTTPALIEKKSRRQIYKKDDFLVQEKAHTYGIFSPAIELPKKNYRLKPYHLGLLLGDGYLGHSRKGIIFTNADKKLISEIRILTKQFDLICKKLKHKKFEYSLKRKNPKEKKNKLMEELRKLNLYKKLSCEKFIPPSYLLGSIKQRLELLAGLLDTDGYKSYRDTSTYQYVTSSDQLSFDIFNLCKSIGFGVTLKKRKKGWTHRGVKKEKEYSSLIISPQDFIIPVRLKRKQHSLRNKEWKDVRTKQMTIIKENKKEKVYGFTLDSPSGWYITTDWIITHNTGKSLPAIYFAVNKYLTGKVKRVLVITPASVKETFAEEIKKHTSLSYEILSGDLKQRKLQLKNTTTFFVIVNYDILSKMQKELKASQSGMCILDEVSYCKSFRSKRSRAVYNITKDIPYKIGLTGTLLANRVPDIFSPFRIVEPSIFGYSFWNFKLEYCVMKEIFMGHRSFMKIIDFKNLEDLHKKIFSISILKKKEFCLNLPPKIYEVRKIEMPLSLKKIYNEMKKKLYLEFENGEVTAVNALVKVMKLSQITSGFVFDDVGKVIELDKNPKLNELMSFLDEVDEKTIIWCRFKYSLRKIYQKLKDRAVLFSGDTKEKDKMKMINTFNNDPKTQFFIGSISLGIGINLPVATLAIFHESTFNLGERIQSEGRCYRQGQIGKKVTFVDLLVKDSIDEVIYKTLQEKEDLSKKVLEYLGEKKS